MPRRYADITGHITAESAESAPRLFAEEDEPNMSTDRMSLDTVKALRAPFNADQVKWKIQTNPRDDDREKYAIVVAYIDARDVCERLDLATGGEWSDEYARPVMVAGSLASLECALTVCGITRRDVGTVALPDERRQSVEDNTKDLYSDAFKRAAVKFGIGAHIYRFPNVKAKAEQFGRSWYITRDAQHDLENLTARIVSGQQPARYQHLKVTGNAYGADGAAPEAAEPPQTESKPRPEPPTTQTGTATNGARPPATDKQRQMIARMVDSLGWTPEQLINYARAERVDINELRSQEASALIDSLKTLASQPRQAPRQAPKVEATPQPGARQPPPANAAEARARFFERYRATVGNTWESAQNALQTRSPEPSTVEGWIAAAEAARDLQRQQAETMPA